MIENLPEARETAFGNNEIYYMNSLELCRLYERPFCQYLKNRKECIVYYKDHGEIKSVMGTLELSNDEIDRFTKIVVRTDKGEYTQINISDIERITTD